MIKCLYCGVEMNLGCVCDDCELENRRRILKNGIARSARLSAEAAKLGDYDLAREFDQLMTQDNQELHELENAAT